MPPRNSIILMDAVAIKAAHDTRCWNPLRNGFELRSVPICVQEATQRSKKGRQLVDRSFEEVAAEIQLVEVTDEMLLDLDFALGLRIDVDEGERHLLAYSLTLGRELWWLCGPDKGTLGALHHLGKLDRMVSVEAMGRVAGHQFGNLSHQYKESWLSSQRTKYLFGDV